MRAVGSCGGFSAIDGQRSSERVVMSIQAIRSGAATPSTADRALHRIVAEIVDGLRHGYFEYSLTCEVIGQGRRRLILHAGKNFQFVIPGDECKATDRPTFPDDRGLVDACPWHGPDNNPFDGSQDSTNDL